jgi:murein peptide amidase A
MTTTVPFAARELARSVQNRPIEGVFFGSDDPERLDTLFLGVFHGDEGIAGDLMHQFITHLQAGNDIDFARHPVLIVPVLNPDGLHARTRMNANAVDLNRNYPTPDWQEENRDTVYYSGPDAASEPETRLVMQLIERYRPCKIITVHCPYKVLNFDGPGQALAEAMGRRSGYPVVADIGYPTPGSFGTWAGKIRQIPVVTLELPPNPDDPFDPELPAPEPFEKVWQDNRAALEAAIRFQF